MNDSNIETEMDFQSILKLFTETVLIVILITVLIASSVMLKSTLFGISFFLCMLSIGIYTVIMKLPGIIPLYSCLISFFFWTAHSYMMRHDDPVISYSDINYHFHDQLLTNATSIEIISEAYGVSGSFSLIYSLILFVPFTICSTLEVPKPYLKYRAFSILIILVSVSIEPNKDANLATSPLPLVVLRSLFAVVLFMLNSYVIKFTSHSDVVSNNKVTNRLGIRCILNMLHCLMAQFAVSCILFSIQIVIYLFIFLVQQRESSKINLWFNSIWCPLVVSSIYNHFNNTTESEDETSDDESKSGESEVSDGN